MHSHPFMQGEHGPTALRTRPAQRLYVLLFSLNAVLRSVAAPRTLWAAGTVRSQPRPIHAHPAVREPRSDSSARLVHDVTWVMVYRAWLPAVKSCT